MAEKKPDTLRSTLEVGSSVHAEVRSSASVRLGKEQEVFEARWKERSAAIEASFAEQERATTEGAARWDQMEAWLLRDHTARLKEVSMAVARNEAYANAMMEWWEGEVQSLSARLDARLEASLSQSVKVAVRQNLDADLEARSEGVKATLLAFLRDELSFVREEVTLVRKGNKELMALVEETQSMMDRRLLAHRTRILEEVGNQRDTQSYVDGRLERLQRTLQEDLDQELSARLSQQVKTELSAWVARVEALQFDLQALSGKVKGADRDLLRLLDTRVESVRSSFSQTVDLAALTELRTRLENLERTDRELRGLFESRFQQERSNLKETVFLELRQEMERRVGEREEQRIRTERELRSFVESRLETLKTRETTGKETGILELRQEMERREEQRIRSERELRSLFEGRLETLHSSLHETIVKESSQEWSRQWESREEERSSSSRESERLRRLTESQSAQILQMERSLILLQERVEELEIRYRPPEPPRRPPEPPPPPRRPPNSRPPEPPEPPRRPPEPPPEPPLPPERPPEPPEPELPELPLDPPDPPDAPPAPPPRARWPWILGILLLISLFFVVVAYAWRGTPPPPTVQTPPPKPPVTTVTPPPTVPTPPPPGTSVTPPSPLRWNGKIDWSTRLTVDSFAACDRKFSTEVGTRWSTWNDTDPVHENSCTLGTSTSTLTLLQGGYNNSACALQWTSLLKPGGRQTFAGAAVGIPLGSLQGYHSLALVLRGDGKPVRVRFPMVDQVAQAQQEGCRSHYWDFYGADLKCGDGTNTWVRTTVDLTHLAQEHWGQKLALNLSDVQSLDLQVSGNPKKTDLQRSCDIGLVELSP